MAFNGSGTYNLPAADLPVSGQLISSTKMNGVLTDIATALSLCLARDGQSTMTGNLNMGSQSITGMGAGNAGTPSLRWGESQGFYRSASGELSVSTNGTLRSTWKSDGTLLFGTTATQWAVDVSNRLLNTGNTQPAFNASRSGPQTSGSVVAFPTENLDQGGVYNNSTYVFTAPIAGKYFISAVVNFTNTSGATWSAYITVRKNGSATPAVASVQVPNTGVAVTASAALVLSLGANDTIDITCPTLSSTLNVDASGTVFSGYLLS